jgi:hypothetical protein
MPIIQCDIRESAHHVKAGKPLPDWKPGDGHAR